MHANTSSARMADQYAVVYAAGISMAIPLADVGHAAPLDLPVTRVPRSKNALVGVLRHGGQVIPVVDLASWGSLRSSRATSAPGSQVLLLRSNGRLAGLRIERTMGIAHAPPNSIHRIHHDDSEHELFHSVLQAEGWELPLAVLQTDRLMRLTQAWVREAAGEGDVPVCAPAAATPSGTSTAPASPRSIGPHAVVRLRGHYFAFPASVVARVVPTPRVQELGHLSQSLYGIFTWGTQEVPVVQANQALGLEPLLPGQGQHDCLLIVQTEDQTLGILIDHFIEVRKLEADDLQPALVPAATGAILDRRNGDGSPLHIVSLPRLLSMLPVGTLGARPHTENAPARTAPTRKETCQAHLIFRAGRTMATPLKCILQILPLPRTQQAENEPLPTHITWRDKLLPLRDLRPRTEGPGSAVRAESRVLIVQKASQQWALAVESVLDLAPRFSGKVVGLKLNRGREIKMLSVGANGQQRSYEIVDLMHLEPPAARRPAPALATSAAFDRQEADDAGRLAGANHTQK